jgi:PAS domain S-box-containing protein
VQTPHPPTTRTAPIIERSPLPIVEVQGNTHVVSYVNPAFCQLLGKSQEDLLGHTFGQIVPMGEECLPVLDQVYKTGQAATRAQRVETESHPADWLYAIWPTLDDHARPVGVIIQLSKITTFQRDSRAINEALLISGLRQHELTAEAEKLNGQLAREINERKFAEAGLQAANRQLAGQADELERLVRERTEKLRETVADLEGFSYSVAHEMRSPLRGMQGFARILLDEHAGALDGVARGHLAQIASSAARMDLLIQDVLNYTRVMRSEALVVPVDLDKLVRGLIATHPNWQPPKADIRIEGTLPRVSGHEGFLAQGVSNILHNAVKFVAPGVIPRVRIRAESGPLPSAENPGIAGPATVAGEPARDQPVVRVWFEDNGIGIARTDRHRVFQMFERINPASQFEGTGIGLTIARKAIQRLGGQIGFTSEPGPGTRFWIDLKPAPSPAPIHPGTP